MDKAKITRLCNEIEDLATEIQERTMKDSYFMAQTIINKVLVVAAEVSAKPKTNGDRIRQMTDEELARWLNNEASCTCGICIGQRDKSSCTQYMCEECIAKWLEQEVDVSETD